MVAGALGAFVTDVVDLDRAAVAAAVAGTGSGVMVGQIAAPSDGDDGFVVTTDLDPAIQPFLTTTASMAHPSCPV